jgi:periplasmic divalent cation tolerance protein
MDNFIQIHWTSGSIDEARKVCRHLVKNRLVACANLIPWVESIYMWDNQLDTTQETKIILKTRESSFQSVRDYIQNNTSYELPEITKILIDGGNQEYLEWLEKNTDPAAAAITS